MKLTLEVWTVTLLLLFQQQLSFCATPTNKSKDSKESYNILMIMPFCSKSHKIVFDAVAEELEKHGHKVTIMSSIKEAKATIGSGIKNVYLENSANVMDGGAISFFKMSSFAFLTLFDTVIQVCDAAFSSPPLRDLIQNPRDPHTGKPKFDVVVVDAVFNECTLALAHHLQVPSIYVSPGPGFPTIAWSMNVPMPYSYVPAALLGLPPSGAMSFTQRTLNTFAILSFMATKQWVSIKMDAVIQSHFPNAASLNALEQNVSFYITNTHAAISGSAPGMPYTKELACLNCKPAKSLPKDLEEFMQSSGKDGVIYFSLGSYTKGEAMPLDMRRKLLDAFARVPQKVLWKYEKNIDDLPKNVKLITWAPQQDLLAHPKLRLFITHGGGLSTLESGYHSCPVLGFPLSADQWGNMANAFRAGFAEFLNWKTFTSDELVQKIKTIVNDSRYKDRAIQISKLLRDQPQPPVEKAAFWIEYVVRHKGARHLKSDADQLNILQYFLIDVILFFIFILLFIVLTIKFILKTCWRCTFGRKSGMKSELGTKKKRN